MGQLPTEPEYFPFVDLQADAEGGVRALEAFAEPVAECGQVRVHGDANPGPYPCELGIQPLPEPGQVRPRLDLDAGPALDAV
ncbi:hypothetical protein [Streptomyces sp. NPDC058989]|uniref:hypothetical protein n=1 Tax=Streptomyces sp. NPDC058989 TaxID=3346686 RepID=UPI0036810E73